ncbi:MAG TPA: cytochrome c oxidase assembly factor Coa1 family protein [Pyrinomonadaceae bacterium]|nr:cytochrome c oxidase assembly factor Coa1 family protein [Pyrinomonadaceae bacterium]
MTNRKIVFIILGIVASIVFLVLIFAAGIVGFAIYSIGNSQAAETAKNFLRNNEKLKADIGEVKDFGRFVTGSVSIANDSGEAVINLKVIGDRESVNATVHLLFTSGQSWRVSSASYVNRLGQTVNLQDPYDSKRINTPPLFLAAA